MCCYSNGCIITEGLGVVLQCGVRRCHARCCDVKVIIMKGVMWYGEGCGITVKDVVLW